MRAASRGAPPGVFRAPALPAGLRPPMAHASRRVAVWDHVAWLPRRPGAESIRAGRRARAPVSYRIARAAWSYRRRRAERGAPDCHAAARGEPTCPAAGTVGRASARTALGGRRTLRLRPPPPHWGEWT